MAISDKIGAAVSEWLFNVASSILPQFRIPQHSGLGNIMQGFFGIDPASYNVWKELGFLAEPLIQTMVTPIINRYMEGMTEEQAKEIAMKFADSFIEQAHKEGSVNLFGVEVGEGAFKALKEILTNHLE